MLCLFSSRDFHFSFIDIGSQPQHPHARHKPRCPRWQRQRLSPWVGTSRRAVMLAMTKTQMEEMRVNGVRRLLPLPSFPPARAPCPRRYSRDVRVPGPDTPCLSQFTVMDSFFQGDELADIVAGLEASIEAKKAGVDKVADVFLELVDHPSILPYLVDMLGTNIQLRDAVNTQ